MNNWIDIEHQRPKNNERVICLLPFGTLIQDDTWTDKHGFLNNQGMISHWQPINPPGTYTQIMQREKGPLNNQNPPEPLNRPEPAEWYSNAIKEHMNMMNSLLLTQLALRLEAKPTIEEKPTAKPNTPARSGIET